MSDDNPDTSAETPVTRARERRRVRRFKRTSLGITAVIILTAATIFAVALLVIFVL